MGTRCRFSSRARVPRRASRWRSNGCGARSRTRAMRCTGSSGSANSRPECTPTRNHGDCRRAFAASAGTWRRWGGRGGFWGPWRAAIGLDAEGAVILEGALELIRLRLERFGQSSDVFGLVHADLRLANLLADGSRLRIIDFDDCG